MERNPLRYTKKIGCQHKICQDCGGYIPRYGVSGISITEVCHPACAAAAGPACSCKCGGKFHGGENAKELNRLMWGKEQPAGVGYYPDFTQETPPTIAGRKKYVRSKDTVREINLVFRKGQVLENPPQITQSRIAADFIRKVIGRRMTIQEVFVALYLNNANVPIGYTIHSIGSINGTVIDQRMILGTAAKALARSIIVAHNHPSGTLRPSAADIEYSRKLQEACKVVDIMLLDSLIVTEKSYYSLADNNDI